MATIILETIVVLQNKNNTKYRKLAICLEKNGSATSGKLAVLCSTSKFHPVSKNDWKKLAELGNS